ncbi:GAF domain-containing protein [Chryseolinea sp. T2]|uniref:GAF domain-containing protein n=1 Tax=Chryseolinea sp. T2 TaxID=3129255 RepID=UPI003077EA36
MKKFFTENLVVIILGVSFLTSTLFAIRNNIIIERNHVIQKQSDLLKQKTQDILVKTVHGLDLGVRGYGLTKYDKLLAPYQEAIAISAGTFRQVDSLLAVQNYPERAGLQDVKQEVDKYIVFSNQMMAVAKSNENEKLVSMLMEDRGTALWERYSAFKVPLFKFEDDLIRESQADYQFAVRSNLILQIAFFVIGFPMIFVFVAKVKKERAARKKVLERVETTDVTFVFNPGTKESKSDDAINETSIENIRSASTFVQAVASGNYEVEWKGMTSENIKINNSTLAGNLVNLRDRLKEIKKEDEQRNWTNEGLAEFSEIVRTHQQNPEELSIKCISFLTKYIQAQQGSLFVLDQSGDVPALKLAGCYAFDKRKFVEKTIGIGEGIVGQAYLEGEPIMLKQIPQGYTRITSGLGDSTPSSLAIVPLKTDSQVVAILEVATFHQLAPYQISFLQRAGEFLASAINSTTNTAQMKRMLSEAATREEEMRQREEELRQNMEELQATQEELARRQKEYDRMN